MNDSRYKYNADGTMIFNDLSAIEIPLTKVSSGYGSNEVAKVSFDHYKAMFDMLAMIKTVAKLYHNASFNTFKKLKIHFLHAHGKWFVQYYVSVHLVWLTVLLLYIGNSIGHWQMSTQAPGIYIMTKEQRVNVPIS